MVLGPDRGPPTCVLISDKHGNPSTPPEKSAAEKPGRPQPSTSEAGPAVPPAQRQLRTAGASAGSLLAGSLLDGKLMLRDIMHIRVQDIMLVHRMLLRYIAY